MTIEKKIRLLSITVLVLIATNIATIATIYFNPFGGSRYTRSTYLQNMGQQMRNAKFSPEQMQMMRQIRHEFMDENQATMDRMRDIHQQLHLELLKENPDSSKIQELLNEIGTTYAQMKGLTVKHFLLLKPHCSPEQQQLLLQFDDPSQRRPMRHGRNGRGMMNRPNN